MLDHSVGLHCYDLAPSELLLHGILPLSIRVNVLAIRLLSITDLHDLFMPSVRDLHFSFRFTLLGRSIFYLFIYIVLLNWSWTARELFLLAHNIDPNHFDDYPIVNVDIPWCVPLSCDDPIDTHRRNCCKHVPDHVWQWRLHCCALYAIICKPRQHIGRWSQPYWIRMHIFTIRRLFGHS